MVAKDRLDTIVEVFKRRVEAPEYLSCPNEPRFKGALQRLWAVYQTSPKGSGLMTLYECSRCGFTLSLTKWGDGSVEVSHGERREEESPDPGDGREAT